MDRLEKDEIQMVFRIVKLNAQIKNVSYVLAFDDFIVANALKDKFVDGRAYLEKMIQVPLKLPKARYEDLFEHCIESLNNVLKSKDFKINEKEAEELVGIVRSVFMYEMDNPRQIVRLINSFSFSVSILYGEVSIKDLLVIELCKVFAPETYEFIRDNKDVFLPHTGFLRSIHNNYYDKEDQKRFDLFKSSLKEDKESLSVEIIKKLFPNMEYLFKENGSRQPPYGVETEKRVNDSNYIDRYFTFSVSKDDISDVAIDKFIANMSKSDLKNFKDELIDRSDKLNIVFFTKLRNRTNDILEKEKEYILCDLIYYNDQYLSKRSVNYQDVFSSVVFLICEIMKQLEQSKILLFIRNYICKFASKSDLNIRVLRSYSYYLEKDYNGKQLGEELKSGFNKIYLSYIIENCLENDDWLFQDKAVHYLLAEFAKINEKRIKTIVNDKITNLEGFCELLVELYQCKENDNRFNEYKRHLEEFCGISVIQEKLEDKYQLDRSNTSRQSIEPQTLVNFYNCLVKFTS